MGAGLLGTTATLLGVCLGVVGHGLGPAAVGATGAAIGIAVVWPRRSTVLAVVGLAAVAMGAHARDVALRPPPAAIAGPDAPVSVTGVVSSDASLGESGARIDLRVGEFDVRVVVGGTMAASGVAQWTRGRVLTAPVRLRVPDLIRNPGSPSEAWQVLTARFDLVGTVKSGALVDVRPASWHEEAAAKARRHVRRTMARWLGPRGSTTQAVVTAILIGDRVGLDDTVVRRLQAAGTFHVMAISGGNIAMLTVACFLGLRLVTRSVVLPPVITALVVLVYGGIVGGDPSVMRAVLAAVVYLAVRLAGISPRPINLLAVVGATCAVWDPLMVVDVGAWLSFGATFGLIVVLPRFGASSRVKAAVLATVAVEIIILPISAAVFGRVGVAGLVLNLIAVPVMAVIQLAGLLLSVTALVSDPASAGLAWIAHAATSVLIGSSAALDVAPWLSWRVPSSSPTWIAAYYVLVLLVLSQSRRRWRLMAAGGAAACLLVVVASPFVAVRRPPPGWLRLSVLDVGQGDALLVQTPGRQALLVDAGGTPGGQFDVGGRVVTPAIWALGERRLTWFALTHGDLDHIGGAARVVEDLQPGEVWEGIPVDSSDTLQRLRALVHARGLVWRRLTAGHLIEAGPVVVRVLHPPPHDWQRVRVRNDDSLVIEVRYGDVSMLLTGDVGAEFERAAPADLPWGRRPRIRVLKVAHHGSRSSTSETFVDRYRPHIGLVSVGRSNVFGHPAPQVVARLGARGAEVYRTDRDGAIIVETDGREVRVRAAAGPRLWLF